MEETIKEKVEQLERMETAAGEQGWGGDFREGVADSMIRYLKTDPRPTLHGLLNYLLI